MVVWLEFMLEVATLNVMVTAEYVSVATVCIDKRGRIDRSSQTIAPDPSAGGDAGRKPIKRRRQGRGRGPETL
jgi:hypothetical protein